MKKSNRKGFTIVELVIVIAVIAILAAVLIPTFSNLIKKANESSDIQAVRQMNTILAAENAFVGGITINDAVKALKEAGFNGDKYVPLVSGHYFFYDQNTKQIVYTEYKDGQYNVLFPKDATIEGHSLFSLSGDVAKKDYADPTVVDNTATFSIGSAEEFAQLAADFKAIAANEIPEGLKAYFSQYYDGGNKIYGVTGKNIVIDLKNDIDMRGAFFNLNLFDVSFTLNGNGHTISGVVNNSGFATSAQNGENLLSEYGSGFLGYVGKATIKFNDVTFKNCHFGNVGVKGSAVFVGQLNGESTITFNDTKVVNCTVEGKYGVAVYVGHAYAEKGTNTIEFEGANTVSGCELTANASDDRIAKISGRVTETSAGHKTTIKNSTTVEGTVSPAFENVTIVVAGSIVDATNRDIVSVLYGSSGPSVESYDGDWANKQ